MSNLKDLLKVSDGVYLFELQPLTVKLDKPIYTGMICLDLAKVFMVRYHYKMVSHFGRDQIQLLYTDTDSFIYHIFVDNLYHSLIDLKEDFDFSYYPREHPLYNTLNKCKRGKWKDETKGRILEEGVFLRAKCYSLKIVKGSDVSNIKAAAGVTRSAQKQLYHQDYKDALFNSRNLYVNQRRFGSVNHTIYTYEESKLALTNFDDKRYQVDMVRTLPYGHVLLDF